MYDDDYKSMDTLETKSFSRVIGDNSNASELGSIVSARLLKSIYQSEDWIYILIDRIASKLAQIPWQVHSERFENGEHILEPALNHPVQRMLDEPNPLQPSYSFKYSCITDHCATGNAIVYYSSMNRWLVQIPTEIIWMDIRGDGNLNSYDIVGVDPMSFPVNMRTKIKPQDIIHVKRPNPSSVYWGLSPLVPGANPALFNKYSNEYLLNFYKKGAQPGIVLEMNEETNEIQAKKLLQSLETAYTGRANQRRGLVLPKGVKANNIAHTLADQQLIEYIRNNRETLINIFGVPKQELSIQDVGGGLGSEEYKTALKNFWQGPLMSIGMMFETAFTAKLKPLLGNGYIIKLNYSGVPILQEDIAEKAKTGNEMLSTLTYNEVRQRIWKLPPIEGGDVLRDFRPPANSFMPGYAPSLSALSVETPKLAEGKTASASLTGPQVTALMNIVEQASLGKISKETAINIIEAAFSISKEQAEKILGSVGQSNAPEPQEVKELASEEVDYRKANVEAFSAHVKSDENRWFKESRDKIDEESGKAIGKIEELWLKLLSDQVIAAVKVAKANMNEKAATVPNKRKLRRQIDEAMDGVEKKWRKDYADTLEAQIDLGYDASLSVPFNEPYKDGIEAIKSKNKDKRREVLEARALDSFDRISKTTTEKIMSTIEGGMKESLSIGEIASKIQEVAKVSAGRAMTIARTETLIANSIGEAAAMQDAAQVIPNLVKVWINANDERVRGNPGGLYPESEADHWSIMGEIVSHDEKYSNGLSYPRDTSGPANEIINCRCSQLAVSEDDLGRLGLKR
jgi:HK97 family phage portal protein